jgi:hypothetical protein
MFRLNGKFIFLAERRDWLVMGNLGWRRLVFSLRLNGGVVSSDALAGGRWDAEHGGLLLLELVASRSLSGGPVTCVSPDALAGGSPAATFFSCAHLGGPREKKAKEGAKVNTHVGVSSD